MGEAVRKVEKIIGYEFQNKKFLEEALSHPSIRKPPSYERLEFLGDAVLGLAVSQHIYQKNPRLDQGQLTNLRSANVSTKRLARVALRHGLYDHVSRNCPGLDQRIKEFAEAVSKEDETNALHGGSVKAPKGLADIVESIAAAVYVDTKYDLEKLWSIFGVLLEPLVTYEHLQRQPISKKGKKVQKIIDGFLIADKNNGLCEVEAAQEKLNILCDKMKWSKPNYKEMKKEGPPRKPIYVYSVQIPENGDISYKGDEKSRIRYAKNSAASHMIRALSDKQKANRI